MNYETLVPFFSAALILGIIPGPDNIFVLMQSVMHGRKAGLLVVLGLCTGLLVHSSFVAFGVAAVFQSSSWAFNGLKVLGCGYLLYLAWQSFKAPANQLESGECPALTSSQLYVRGFIMNVSNPKVAIFFLAFLPQFTQPQLGHLTWQLLLLGGLFIVATIIVFSSIALMSATLARGFKESLLAQNLLHKTAAIIFLLLAFKLVFTSL